MSFIDDSNKSLKNRPFDSLSEKDSLKSLDVHYEAIKDDELATYLSTRASIFAACVMVSISLLVPYSYPGIIDLLKSLGLAVSGVALYVLIWTLTFRFFEKPSLMPLNIVLNVLPAAIIAYVMNSINAFESYCVLAGGVTCLALMSDDVPARDEFAKKGFSTVELFDGEFVKSIYFEKAKIVPEIIVPLFIGVVSSTIGVLITSYIARLGAVLNAGVRLMVTSLILMIVSFVISKIRGRDFYISSTKINDKYELPSVAFHTLRSFVLRRLRFAGSLALICLGCFLSDYLCTVLSIEFAFIKYALALVLIFAFSFARGRHSNYKAQYAVELCLCYAVGIGRCFTIQATLITILAGILVDFLLTGMLFTYKRTLIHSKRSKYVEGMPLILLSISLLLIVCATVLDYWAVML